MSSTEEGSHLRTNVGSGVNPPPPAPVMVSVRVKNKIKKFKKVNKKVLANETELNSQRMEVMNFFLGHMNGFVILIGTGMVGGLFAGENTTTYVAFGSLVLSFLLGVVGAAFISFKMLKNLKLEDSINEKKRDQLVTDARGYSLTQTVPENAEPTQLSLSNAQNQVNAIMETHRSSHAKLVGSFMIFWRTMSLALGMYLVWVLAWIIYIDPKNGIQNILLEILQTSRRLP